MSYNPNIHDRRSIRLKGYDYSQAGLYFITICVQNREHLFGKIVAWENLPACPNKMILNDAGKIIEHWYYELENKFNDIKCHEMVVMPNHFHCIIENTGSVGADLCVGPDNPSAGPDSLGGRKPDTLDKSNTLGEPKSDNVLGKPKPDNVLGEPNNVLGEHIGSPLHRVVQWFKTMTTNHYIRGVKQHKWQPFDGKLWQRNYWEHIIRNNDDYQRIARYIMNNPKNWGNDKLK